MTNWTALVAKLNKAEKDVTEWAAGLRDAENTLSECRGEMALALGMGKTKNGNGSAHRASAATVPVKIVVKKKQPHRTTHDYKRRGRVVDLAKAKGGFITTSDVVSGEKIRRQTAHSVLFDLAKSGLLVRVAPGRYSLPPANAQKVA